MCRQRHLKLFSVLMAAALLLAVMGGGLALAQGTPSAPVLPESFWGSVMDASGNPILNGTVEAWMNGIKQDSIAIANGQYGGPGGFDDRLLVQGTSEDVGKTIEFYVNGVKANETAIYRPGEKTNLNLTVSGLPQPPSDTTPPVVSSTDPDNGATGVELGKTISVYFSEDVQAGSAYDSISVKDASGDAVAVAKSITGKVLSIMPNASLAYNTKYTVTVPKGAVQDLAGNALAQQFTFSFTTLAAPDTNPPAVESTDPADKATSVSVSKTIAVTFSEEIVAGAAYDSISVKDAAGNSVAVSKTISGKTLSIKPGTSLAYNTSYIVNIPAGAVKDLAGNAMTNDFTFSFTTQAASSSGGGGGGGGGGSATTPLANKVEKPVQAGTTTVAEVPGKVKVELPAGNVTGTNATIKAEVMGDEKASGAGMPLIGKVVDVTLKNGTLNGKLTITLYYDKTKLGSNQEPVAFYYDEKNGKWVRLQGIVDTGKGTVTVTVDHLTMFAVFAVSRQVEQPQPPQPGTTVTFKDMQGHWAADAVSRLAGAGIISGYPDGTFGPERKVTRAEVTAIVAKLLQLEQGNESELNFRDNAAIPAWAKGVIAAAVKDGIIKGYPQPDGSMTFEASRQVSRAEMAAIAARVLEKKLGSLSTAELKFTDAAAIPAWAKDSIARAVAKGIVSGYPDGTFRAGKSITRAETAAIMLRLMDLLGA